MNAECIVEALKAALPKLRGTGVAKLKSALAQYDEASKPQHMSAKRIGIKRRDYDACMEWIRKQPKAQLSRDWYGSHDSGHIEQTLVLPEEAKAPQEVLDAFERISEAIFENQSGLEEGRGGEVCVSMDQDGLEFCVSYTESVYQGAVIVSFDKPPALGKQKALPAP